MKQSTFNGKIVPVSRKMTKSSFGVVLIFTFIIEMFTVSLLSAFQEKDKVQFHFMLRLDFDDLEFYARERENSQ